MSKKERWDLGVFPAETKTKIQEIAKKKNMFANELVQEILNDYLFDIELGQNKNYFDRRWQEVIEGYKFLAVAQNENTEVSTKDFKTLVSEVEKLTKIIFETYQSVEMLRAVQQMMIGYSTDETKKFATAYKKYFGEELKGFEVSDDWEKTEDDTWEGKEF